MKGIEAATFVEEAAEQAKSVVVDIKCLEESYKDRLKHYASQADAHRRAASYYDEAARNIEQLLNNEYLNSQSPTDPLSFKNDDDSKTVALPGRFAS